MIAGRQTNRKFSRKMLLDGRSIFQFERIFCYRLIFRVLELRFAVPKLNVRGMFGDI